MTLVECLVALVLASLVSAAVVSVMATQSRLLRSLASGSADAEAARTAVGILGEELRWVDPLRDVRAIGGDSVILRVFRGGGRVCHVADDAVTVMYAGTRRPDASKDSVLLYTAAGESAYVLRDVTEATCGVDPALRLRTGMPAPPSAYALVFESGSYFVRDRALRYRLGREGRQPLTDERFATRGALRLAADSSAALVRLPWPGSRPATTLRVQLLNTHR